MLVGCLANHPAGRRDRTVTYDNNPGPHLNAVDAAWEDVQRQLAQKGPGGALAPLSILKIQIRLLEACLKSMAERELPTPVLNSNIGVHEGLPSPHAVKITPPLVSMIVCPDCGGECGRAQTSFYDGKNMNTMDFQRRWITCKRCGGSGMVVAT